jgi:hypothetical protein
MSKRQSVTRLADRTVGTPQLAEGAVTTDILDQTIVTDISDASADAAAAAADAADASAEAAAALSTANGKNKIYRQTTQPTGGTYADGDLWFDTDDDNKMYRYSSTPSPVWTGFTLGNNALSNISANKITAGTIDASVITVSNINAGNIVAGTLTGISIVGVTIDIGGPDTTSFHVDVNGNMWIGGATYAAAPFKISSAGFVTSTNGATFSGSINSNGDASFAGGDGRQCYIQNDGRYQSVTNGVVYAQMSQSGILTNAINGATQSYIDFFGEYVGFRYNITYGPSDAGWAAAFVPTGNNAVNRGFSGVAYRVGSSPPQQYSYDGFMTYTVPSDRRVKVNIKEVDESFIDKILNDVKIHQFNRINTLDDDDLHVYATELGVIADEFEEVFPQWVTSYYMKDPNGTDKDKIRSVNYESIVPGLVLIIQKFNARIKELEDRLSE